jgi:hypothetical protein
MHYGADDEPPHPLLAAASVVFGALWTVSATVPAVAFGRAFRLGRDRGARAFAGCGLAMLLVLFAGELTGAISVYPWHTRFSIVPGPIDRPVRR